MTTQELSDLERLIRSNNHIDNEHIIIKLIDRIRFLEARQTELQTRGTELVEENRKLKSKIKHFGLENVGCCEGE